MIYLLAIPVLAAAAGLAYLATLPATLSVRRSLTIGADRQRVFERVRDLSSWGDWSPWLMHEPDARVVLSSDQDREGGTYSWDGQRIGAGTLTHVRLVDNERIEQRLDFTRPFKSSNKVLWELADAQGGTQLTWSMEGPMPLFLRPIAPTMAAAIEKDYELGLAMLRGVLEPDAPRPRIRFAGPAERAPVTALTIPFKGAMDAMVQAMQEGFPRLAAQVQAQGRDPAGPPFTAYYRVDSKAQRFECDMALPVTPDCPPGDLARKVLPGGRYFAVELEGSYDFLPLAWFSAMAHLRMLKLKADKGRPFFETYENDPEGVSHSNGLRTRLDIPIR